MKKSSVPSVFRRALPLIALFACVSIQADPPPAPYLSVHVGMSGSDAIPFRTTLNATVSPLSDSAVGAVSDILLSAEYGKLVVNTNGNVPSDPAENISASVSGFAKWTDTFTFTSSDPLLSGTTATAHFTLSLTGTYAYQIASGASPALGDYDLESSAGTIAAGDFSFGGGLTHGEQDISHLASLSFDQNFTIGTPFDVMIQMINGVSVHSVDGHSSFAHIDLTLTNTGLTALDNSSAPIAGAFSTASGHDYTVAAIPEPATSAMLAGLAAVGLAALRRRRRGCV